MDIDIARNLALVEERINIACQKAGRSRNAVTLVAVTKTVAPVAIRAAYEAGVRHMGENRVQEREDKMEALRDLNVTWHLIGHLQTNKARRARELFHTIHTLDSLRLAQKLNAASSGADRRLPVLLEVNLGGEAAKSGIAESDAPALAEGMTALPGLELRGLMTVPPFLENPDDVRPFFRRLRQLAERIEALRLPGTSMRELSMGMSHDFEVAIEEGATLVRLGTAIFGPR